MEKIWLKHYPPGVPHSVDPAAYNSLVELLDEGLTRHAPLPAYRFMGRAWLFSDIDAASRRMAAYLHGLGLKPGDRVAVMLPNVPQYPVVVAAILRAGMVVVNVNPLYTPRELEHQLKDSGSAAIFILENFAHTLQEVIGATPVRHVVLTSLGDMLGLVKGAVVNMVVRRVRKLVPPFDLPSAVRFNKALRIGRGQAFTPARPGPDDVAVLQYTGGTTGVSKGATLTHRNVVASMLLSEAWNKAVIDPIARQEQFTMVAALPLYHIFGFAVNMMLGMHLGACNILIPNPRDLPAMFKELSRYRFHSFPAVNTLFAAMARHPDFRSVDWSALRQSVGGGMAVHQATAKLWKDKTGLVICEGYGLSETTAGVTCNPGQQQAFTGGIGLPLPSTEVVILDEDGRELPTGSPGELAVRGPQVMSGYWQRPDETAKVMTLDGFMRTGDICVMDERGYIKLIDRKKDMILVSGFNVYPNEIEDAVALLPGVKECAAIGIPDERSGEAVKLFVVRDRADLSEQAVRDHCAQVLTGYKRPKVVAFRQDLPKTPIGKVLRRALRDAEPAVVAEASARQAEQALTEAP
ncbi:MAG: AMP-binding protein [Aquabacterium sp.]|uniref:AMP-binding protein n=1 Tax=Aquabacterium sp. TaxID=1872578 RepID=UPI0025BBC568|nr:AMP-binding protein [Aquabacterium sp.]MBI5924718.1 AMP-binding protein [Aquabacterium sp.]